MVLRPEVARFYLQPSAFSIQPNQTTTMHLITIVFVALAGIGLALPHGPSSTMILRNATVPRNMAAFRNTTAPRNMALFRNTTVPRNMALFRNTTAPRNMALFRNTTATAPRNAPLRDATTAENNHPSPAPSVLANIQHAPVRACAGMTCSMLCVMHAEACTAARPYEGDYW